MKMEYGVLVSITDSTTFDEVITKAVESFNEHHSITKNITVEDLNVRFVRSFDNSKYYDVRITVEVSN